MILFYAAQFRTTNKVEIRSFCRMLIQIKEQKKIPHKQFSSHLLICRFHSIGNILHFASMLQALHILIFPAFEQLLYFCSESKLSQTDATFSQRKRDQFALKMIFGQSIEHQQ